MTTPATMSPLAPTGRLLGPGVNRFTAFAATLLLGSVLPGMLTTGASLASAQELSTRSVCVTVTDPQGRFVSGLERQHFAVSENGVPSEITDFSDAYSSITVAVVSEESLAATGSLGPADELIQTASLSDALRQLAASTSARKGIVAATGTDMQTVPPGIPALQADAAGMPRAVMALRQQYCLNVEPSLAPARVEVTLHELRALPALNLNSLNWR